jgi:uncharacterized protein (TIGR03083 family)
VTTPDRRELIAQLTETWQSLDGLLGGLAEPDWDLPTACPGWTVADQVAHLIGTESVLAGRRAPALEDVPGPHVRNDMGRFNEAWVHHFRGLPPAEVLRAWRQVTGERQAQLEAMTDGDFAADSWTPVGPGTYGRLMEIRVFDTWVHEQDIREAVGRPGHDQGAAVERSFDEMVGALGYVVGKRAGAGDGSSVTLSLGGRPERTVNVVVDGRGRVVDHLEAEATTRLRLPALTFARLACGRVDPDTVLAGGGVMIEGDRELGRRVVRHLAFTM